MVGRFDSWASSLARCGALFFGLLVLTSGGCRCIDPTLGGVEVGFRVDAAPIDFGRALEGTQVERNVVLHSTGRAALTVAASADAPFSVPELIELPGGSELPLPVTFTAGATKASGTLTLSANGKSVSLALAGEGVHPLECAPSGPCRLPRFDLASGSCVESVSADGDACTPATDCLENGQCNTGVCIGRPRSCDDRNRCTSDACAQGVGCVHTPIACPMPSRACRVPTCDPEAGCGEALAADGTPCGGIDCVTANLCLSGDCRQVPTPDGFICSPRTPCQGEGHCKSQKCERPDPAEMTPAWLVPLALAPAEGGALIAHEGNLFFEACDGGCQLLSYTGSGFLRFGAEHADARGRALVGASSAGVVLLSATGLEALAPATGAPLWSLSFEELPAPAEAVGAAAVCARERIAIDSTGAVVATLSWRPPAPDGGLDAGDAGDGGEALLAGVQTLVQLSGDGGVVFAQTVRGQATQSRLALGPRGELYLYDPAGATARGLLDADAGWALEAWGDFPGADSLAVAADRLAAGAGHLLDADGGARLASIAVGLDGGSLALLPQPVLLSQGRGYAFSRRCLPPGACDPSVEATFVHSFELAEGTLAWEAKILPEGTWGRLNEAAIVPLGGAVVTLTEVELDGGRAAHVQLFAQGKRLSVCPLASGATLGPAVFDSGYVYLLVQRGGAWTLEAFELAGLPLETTGWPMRDGLSGTRRAR